MNDSMHQFINNDYKSLSDYLFSFTGNEFAIISSIIGFIISQDLSIDQVNSLGNFLESVGQFMLAKAAQDQVISNRNKRNYK
ncbi:MAG: hypothetical protein MR270_03790 [Erysipelotrichaceae bacterium]|nr:hypothetical protein [Erysipelotrichaceae bacterium]